MDFMTFDRRLLVSPEIYSNLERIFILPKEEKRKEFDNYLDALKDVKQKMNCLSAKNFIWRDLKAAKRGSCDYCWFSVQCGCPFIKKLELKHTVSVIFHNKGLQNGWKE